MIKAIVFLFCVYLILSQSLNFTLAKMSTKTDSFQWKTIIGGIILIFFSMIVVIIFEFADGKFRANKNQVVLPEPDVTVAGIQKHKGM